MDLLGDLFVLGLILLSAWTFVPKDIRASLSAGAGPALQALSEVLRQVARAGERGAYLLVVGHDRLSNNVSSKPEPAPEPEPLQPQQPTLLQPANVIAKQQTGSNQAIAIAPEIKELADLLDADVDIIEQVLITLARMVDAEEIGETAAIKIGLGIAPGSTSAKYKAAKAALAVLRRQPKSEIVGIEQDPTQPNRAIPIRA